MNVNDRVHEIKGTYKGRVEDNRDPLGIGRVKVRVPTIHGLDKKDNPNQGEYESLSTEDLPWAYPMGTHGGGYDHGSFIIPDVGDYVWVSFGQGDSNNIVYSGGSFGTDSKGTKEYGVGNQKYTSSVGENETPADTNGGDPNVKVIYKSPRGATILIDETSGRECLKIIDRLGQCIVMNSPYDDYDGIVQRGAKSHEPGCGGLSHPQANITIYDAHGHSIKMDESGITIRGNLKVTGYISGKNVL